MKKKISGSGADRDTITKIFKKQENSWEKELKRVPKKTKTFYKLISKALKNNYLNIILRKMDDSSNSDSNYSIDQKIHKSEPVKKSDPKKITFDKDFQTNIPTLIPGLVNGFGNLPNIVNNIKLNSSRVPTF